MDRGADAAGLQVIVHAIGDRANDWMLDVYRDAAAVNGARDRRFRVEHAQHLTPAAIPRFADQRVIASMQPYHAADDGRWAEKRIGPERIKGTYAFRSLLDAGATLAFGSDWTVAPLDPILGIDAAVTRRTIDGANPDGWSPRSGSRWRRRCSAYTHKPRTRASSEDRPGAWHRGCSPTWWCFRKSSGRTRRSAGHPRRHDGRGGEGRLSSGRRGTEPWGERKSNGEASPRGTPAAEPHRQVTVDALCDHFANDVMPVEEFERRVEAVHRAQYGGRPEGTAAGPPRRKPPPRRQQGAVPGQPGPSSGSPYAATSRSRRSWWPSWVAPSRKGRWTPARSNVAVSIMGGTTWTSATRLLGPGVTRSKVFAMMGGVEIVVPPGVNVESHGIGIMGGFDHVHGNEATRTPTRLHCASPAWRSWGGGDHRA